MDGINGIAGLTGLIGFVLMAYFAYFIQVKKELHLKLRETLTLADKDIKENWESYKKSFMEGN